VKQVILEVKLRTETIPEIDADIFNKLCPPYKVILHNDDHNDMQYVIVSLLKSVPSLTEEEAFEIMLTAHNEGTAVVIVCPQETAEYYQDRILSFGITATIEPDE
jgi:ATP-dependent Clp protease adaptor protein ClpS